MNSQLFVNAIGCIVSFIFGVMLLKWAKLKWKAGKELYYSFTQPFYYFKVFWIGFMGVVFLVVPFVVVFRESFMK